MEQLLITIKDGKVQVEVEGTRGNRCLELTQAIEALIGKVDARLMKKEFYSRTQTETKPSVRIKHEYNLQRKEIPQKARS